MKREFDKIHLITIIVIIFSVIGIAYFGVSYQSKLKQYTNNYKENQTILATLQNEYESEQQTETDTEESAADKLNSCVKTGNEVAKLQNAYYSINENDYLDATNEVDYEAYTNALKENSNKLDPYFDKEDTSGNAIWYSNKSTDAIWSFRTTFSFTGTVVPALWTCYNQHGELLAFTTATYDVEKESFSDINILTTAVGRSYVEVDDDNSLADDEKKAKKSKKKTKATKKPKSTKKPTPTKNTSSENNSVTTQNSSQQNNVPAVNKSTSNNTNITTKKPTPTAAPKKTKKKKSNSNSGDWNTDEEYTQWEG